MTQATLTKTKITPLGDRVLVKAVEQQETKRGYPGLAGRQTVHNVYDIKSVGHSNDPDHAQNEGKIVRTKEIYTYPGEDRGERHRKLYHELCSETQTMRLIEIIDKPGQKHQGTADQDNTQVSQRAGRERGIKPHEDQPG